jgi:outer membrane protein TolC
LPIDAEPSLDFMSDFDPEPPEGLEIPASKDVVAKTGSEQEKNQSSTPVEQDTSNEFSTEIIPPNPIDFITQTPGGQPSSMQESELIWWTRNVVQPLIPENQSETTTSDELLHMSLYASPRIQAISKDPLIRELQVIEADADFDPAFFTRNLFEDRTDPVGNSLTVGGGLQFLQDHIFTSDTGIRRKLRTGADFEISQRIGFQNSNSQFFVPQDQGTATLAINVSQPLLRGGGKYFNRIQICIAQSAGEVAWEVFSAELQDELQRVLSAYWQLYYDRSNFLQKRRNVDRGQRILETLIQREKLDSLPSQIARARAAVQSRKTDLANAFRDVRNAESSIRQLIGEEDWLAKQDIEILPVEHPTINDLELPMESVVYTALENRPEIRESASRTRIAALQKDISMNEILPDLTMLLGTYVAGLEGDSDIGQAWVEQFSNTTPGYSVGLEFEIPYRNRAAQSRLSQSHLQLKKLQQEYKENVQRVIAESQIAWRRVKSAYHTLQAAYSSIEAARQDLKQQEQRFETFALIEGDLADGQSPTTLLDQLLDSQERLTVAESVYAQALLELQVASIALNRSTGTLLQHKRVSYERTCDACSPDIRLYQAGDTAYPIEIDQ